MGGQRRRTRTGILPSGGIIDFYDTHAQAGRSDANNAIARSGQMKELAEFITRSRLPNGLALIVGDFNTRKGQPDLESAVSQAGLKWAMTLEPSIDHIFSINSPRYAYETLDTIRVRGTTQGSRPEFMLGHAPSFHEVWNGWFGKPGLTALSDHLGVMSTSALSRCSSPFLASACNSYLSDTED